MTNLVVDIEHLVLDGITDRLEHGQRIGQMMAQELQHLFEQHGLPIAAERGDVSEMTGPHTSLPASRSDERTAQALALAIFYALGDRR
jgi:hypothetical protein